MNFAPTDVNGFPACCYACGCSATGIGIGDSREPRWLCAECVEAVAALDGKGLDAFELRALKDAGDSAGAYLDGIDKTDMANLAQQEWRTFCATMVKAFGASIRRQAQEGRR